MHEKELKDLVSLGFPESHSLQTGDGTLYYTFRLRHFSPLPLNNCPQGGFHMCYTLFSQQRDPRSKRGYTQRAVCIVSQWSPPQVEFFYQLVGILGSKVLQLDMDESERSRVLQEFYRAVATEWPQQGAPALKMPKITNLKVFGYLLELDMPSESILITENGTEPGEEEAKESNQKEQIIEQENFKEIQDNN
jgi:hypothetical protein